ncbi:MAG: hypothetical protein ACOC44_06290 [Promethearchaeia archaeon]
MWLKRHDIGTPLSMKRQYLATMSTHPRFYNFIKALGIFIFLVGILLGITVSAYTASVRGEIRGLLHSKKPFLKIFTVRMGIKFNLYCYNPPLNGMGGIFIFVYANCAFISSNFSTNN